MPIERSIYTGVPADFPVPDIPVALAGAHPKLGLVEENGKFYTPGAAPSEVADAYDLCKDLNRPGF